MDGVSEWRDEGREAASRLPTELEHRRGSVVLSDLGAVNGDRRGRVGAVEFTEGKHETAEEDR